MMDITDKTLEDVFTSLVESGELGRLIAVAVIFAFLSWLITWLYFTKIRYYKLENDLSTAKQHLANKQTELDDAQEQLQNVREKYDELVFLRDRMNAENATKPNKPDVALSEFHI